MTVAVGSTNPVKTAAVKQAFKKVFPKTRWQVVSLEVASGVTAQPMNDNESLIGARNRARKALKKIGADYGVGLEGGLQKIGKLWFDCGWVVVVDKAGREGVGSTVKMLVPPVMMKLIKQGRELGDACDVIFKTKNAKQAEGHFGLMTKNAISRTAGYRDGVISALARFIHPQLFGDKPLKPESPRLKPWHSGHPGEI